MRRLGMCLVGLAFVVGCGTDPREGLVTSTVQLMNDTASKVNSVTDKIEEAKKKKEKDKVWDFKDAIQSAEDLDKTGKELQKNYQRVRTLREPTTAEEKDVLKKQFQGQITDAARKLDEANLKLAASFKELEGEFKKDANNAEWLKFRQKLNDAHSQFQVLAVQSK